MKRNNIPKRLYSVLLLMLIAIVAKAVSTKCYQLNSNPCPATANFNTCSLLSGSGLISADAAPPRAVRAGQSILLTIALSPACITAKAPTLGWEPTPSKIRMACHAGFHLDLELDTSLRSYCRRGGMLFAAPTSLVNRKFISYAQINLGGKPPNFYGQMEDNSRHTSCFNSCKQVIKPHPSLIIAFTGGFRI